MIEEIAMLKHLRGEHDWKQMGYLLGPRRIIVTHYESSGFQWVGPGYTMERIPVRICICGEVRFGGNGGGCSFPSHFEDAAKRGLVDKLFPRVHLVKRGR
jgi:hypothetical protein